MGLLIDTSIIITLERHRQPPSQLKTDVGVQPSFLSAVTASELLHGVHRANTEERQQRRSAFVEGVLDLFEVLPFDLDVARNHSRIWADLRQQGQLIGAHDLMIAATALHHGLTLVTFNRRDFDRVDGLDLLDWKVDG